MPLDLLQERRQRGRICGVPRHHLVGQREAVRRDDQRDHHLHAVGPLVPAVAVSHGHALAFCRSRQPACGRRLRVVRPRARARDGAAGAAGRGCGLPPETGTEPASVRGPSFYAAYSGLFRLIVVQSGSKWSEASGPKWLMAVQGGSWRTKAAPRQGVVIVLLRRFFVRIVHAFFPVGLDRGFSFLRRRL